MKKITSLVAALLASSVGYAGLDQKFDNVDDVDSLVGKVKSVGNVSVEELSTGKCLRVSNPSAVLMLKTNSGEAEDFNCSFDWYVNKVNATPGVVFSLTDFNHNKKLLQLKLVGGKVKATSFSGKKFKLRRLFKPEASKWYRFSLEVESGRYSVVVRERGEDNTKNGDVVYSSLDSKKKFRTNAKVTPHLITVSTWGKKAGAFYDYDNITLAD